MKKMILILSLLVSSSALSSVVTIEGKSVIVPGDADKTKELAIQATMKKAVEVFVVESVTKPTADANYEKLYKAIYTPFKDFVRQYETVSEREDGQFHYVQAKVDIDDVKVQGQLAALGIQAGVGGKPRVAVIASEQNVDGEWVRSYWWGVYSSGIVSETNFNVCEGKISEALSSAGFPMIDLTMDPTETKKAQSYKNVFDRYDENPYSMPAGDTSKLVQAVDNDVKIVVTCQALAKNQGKKSTHFNSIFANVSCKATDIVAKSVLASVQASKAVPHVDPVTGGVQALSEACRDAGSQIVAKLTR